MKFKLFCITLLTFAFIFSNISHAQHTDWFDKDTDYIKLMTKEEGVAQIAMSEILKIYPYWENESSDYLRMLQNGNEHLFYIEDSDNKISNDDKIFFYCSFPHGDTTYFDFYEQKEAYFLYLEKEKTTKRLKLIQDSNTEPDYEINAVKVDRFIENYSALAVEDNYIIYDEWNTLYIAGKIYPKNDSKARFFDSYVFAIKPESEKKTIIELKTIPEKDTTKKYRKQYSSISCTRAYMNEVMVDSTYRRGRYHDYTSTQSNIISGMNRFTLESINLYPEITAKNEDAEDTMTIIYIDHARIRGYETPYAFAGKTAFDIDTLKQNSKLSVPGFFDNAVFIDTLNNTIRFPKSENANILTAGASKGAEGLLSTSINHHISYFDAKGMLISFFKGDSLHTKLFEYDDAKILTFLDEAEGFPIAIAFNMEYNLSSNIYEKIESVTGFNPDGYATNQVWTIVSENSDYKSSGDEHITHSQIVTNGSTTSMQKSEFNLPAGSYSFFANDMTTLIKPEIRTTNKIDLRETSHQAEVIMLTPVEFLEAANRYAEYRSEQLDKIIKVVDVDDIYNQFNFGRQSPYAIKKFLKYAFENWAEPQMRYTVLLGDANSDHAMLLDGTLDNDFIPVYGIPFCDGWYTLLYEDSKTEFVIGRIPANSNEEANAYIDKLIEYDNAQNAPWMKKFLYIAGGNPYEGETFSYRVALSGLKRQVGRAPLYADTLIISRQKDINSEIQADSILTEIDEGACWVTFLGHGAPNVFDLDGWHVEFMSNKGRYGVLVTLSCNTNYFASPTLEKSRNETYIMEPNKGFIGTIGSTWGSSSGYSSELMSHIQANITDTTNPERLLGDIVYKGKSAMDFDGWGNGYTNTKMFFDLLGDPLITLRIPKETDLIIDEKSTTFLSDKGNTTVLENDEYVTINSMVYNLGFMQDTTVSVEIVHTYNSVSDTTTIEYQQFFFKKKFYTRININKQPGIHTITIHADPNMLIDESDDENNILSFQFEVFKEGVLPVDPMPLWNIATKSPIIRVINPQTTEEKSDFKYNFELDVYANGKYEVFHKAKEKEITITENYIQWIPDVKLESGTHYQIKARSELPGLGIESDWIEIPVIADNKYEKNEVTHKINHATHISEISSEKLDIMGNSEKLDIRLSKEKVEYKLISATKDNNVLGSGHYIYMKVGDIIYTDILQNGFFTLDIPVNSEKEIGSFNHYNTWGNVTDQDTSIHWWEDSPSEQLVNFLRNTPENTYVITATSGAAWRVPLAIQYNAPKEHRNAVGALDTLRAAYREYGSALIDSINGNMGYFIWSSWPSQFQSVGRKGAPIGSIAENFNNTGDTLYLEGEFYRYQPHGKFRTNQIGAAKEWKTIELEGNIGNEYTKIIANVYGISREGNEIKLIEKVNSSTIDISEINPNDYPKIYLELNFERESLSYEALKEDNQVFIRGINIDYTPAPELAVVKSKIDINTPKILRGEEFDFDFTIENISPRIDLDESEIHVTVGKNATIDTTISISKLNANKDASFSISNLTDFLENETPIQIGINENFEYPDLYLFNNYATSGFEIEEDTTPPEIEVFFDDLPIHEGTFVSLTPKITINIYDNSPLPITDSTYIHLFVNGVHQPVAETIEYEFTSYDREEFSSEKGLYKKFTISSIPGEMIFGNNPEKGSNSLTIRAQDASGNQSLLELLFNVSQLTIYDSLQTNPNPIRDYKADIFFTLQSQLKDTKTGISIYNMVGQKIRRLEHIAINGKNIIPFDSKDENGNILPAGVYYFQVESLDEFWAEPKTGKFIIVE